MGKYAVSQGMWSVRVASFLDDWRDVDLVALSLQMIIVVVQDLHFLWHHVIFLDQALVLILGGELAIVLDGRREALFHRRLCQQLYVRVRASNEPTRSILVGCPDGSGSVI